MAKALSFKRSSSQPVTIDTVAGTAVNLGSAVAGVQTNSSFPARCVNIETTFDGDTYALLLSSTGAIQIHKYDGTTWSVVGGPYSPALGHTYTPLCIHVVNNTIVALWTDNAVSGDGIRGVKSTDGAIWVSIPNGTTAIFGSLGGHSWVYHSAIWFATAAGLWAIAPLHRTLTLSSVTGGPFTVGETVVGSVSGTTAIVRSLAGVTVKVDMLVGGTGDFSLTDVLTGTTSGAFGPVVTNTMYVDNVDSGVGGGLGGVNGPANQLGSFASWEGDLYFLRPATAVNPTTLYQLNPSWSPTLMLPAPQWSIVPTVGIPTVGMATVSNDAGLACLFVNNVGALGIFFSGVNSTKLATTVSQAVPLQFTDVTNTFLPPAISLKTNLGITLYHDDRRRTNNLQTFFLKDLAASSLYLCPWNGTTAINIAATLPAVDYMLPFSHHGEGSTFTNYSPSVRITSVSQPFPGRMRIDYKVRCNPAHPVDVFGEYSIDGDTFYPMSEGDGDSGSSGLSTSPSGNNYFFYWDAFVDLQCDLESISVRIFARISGL